MLDWLRDAPLWAAGAVLLALQMGAREAGAAFQRRRHAERVEGDEGLTQTGFVVSAILGLLALLIGFTFSLALNRFEARQALANQEAQALATVYDRLAVFAGGAQLAPVIEAHTRRRWREAMGEAPSPADNTAMQGKERLWATAVAVAKAESVPALVPFLLTPLGDSFDRADEAMLERNRRIDGGVLSMLVVLAIASALTLGLTAPEARQRLISAMLFVLLTMSLLSILDLDQPTQGRSQLSDAAWQHALAGMTQDQAARP
jgi:cellobiose-specific phosphotransferase system component IIC